MRNVTITHELKPYADGSGAPCVITVSRLEKDPTGADWSISIAGIGDSRIDFSSLADWRELKEAVERAIEQVSA